MKREMRRSGAQTNYTQRNYMQGSYHKDTYNTSKKHYRELASSSSNYYMSTANAVAQDYLYEEEFQPAVHKAHKPKRKTAPALAQHISTLLVVFLLGMVLVVQYAYIQNLGYQVSQSKNELKTVQDQNEKIKKQIASLGELRNVEAVAVNHMGMHKPEDWEVIYLPKSTAVSEPTTEGQNAMGDAVDKVKDLLGTIIQE